MNECINVFVLFVGAFVSICALMVCVFVLFGVAVVFLSRVHLAVCDFFCLCVVVALLCTYIDYVMCCVR